MLKVFSVYDSKVGAYMNPIFLRSKGEALRAFETSINSSDHIFCKNPEDYTLFELGSWDEEKAKFVLHSTPIALGVAIEFVKTSVIDRTLPPGLVANN